MGKTAIIADLHLGFEGAMRKAGVAFPRVQIEEIRRSLERVLKGVKEVVVAGDLKHEFSENLPHEWRDVEDFLRFLEEKGVEVILVRGNHDNYLKAIARKFGIDVVEEYEVKGIGIIHGHRCKEEWERVIMGHEHPAVKVRVRGGVYSYPCFLRVEGYLVLPAMSPLLSGSDILTLESFLSPCLKVFRPADAEVYAVCDGVYYLGRAGGISGVL